MAEDEALAVYRDLASVPSLEAGRIHHHGDTVMVTTSWSQRDVERISTVKFNRSHMVVGGSGDLGNARVIPVPDATEKNEELMSSFSPCGGYKAVVRQVKNKKGEDQQYIEIWNNTSKVTSMNLTAVDKHGKVYCDAEFGCFSWSSKSDKLLYIAEKKQKKTAAYFDRKSSSDEAEPSRDPLVKGDKFLYRDDWGETMADKCYPVICTFDVATEAVTVLEGIPEEISPAQASWGPDDSGVVFAGLYHEPYKVGIVFCDNRRSAIFHLNLADDKCSLISPDDDKCCRSPRCSPDGSKVIFLQNDAGGPHKHCKQLMMYDWKSQTPSIIADVVGQAADAESFPGLFMNSLPLRCWADDNVTIYVDTMWRSNQKIISINTATKAVSLISKSETYSSWMFVDLKGSLLLAWRGAPNSTGQLVLCDLSQQSPAGDLQWVVVEDNHRVFPEISWKLVSLPRSDGLDIEGILLFPTQSAGKEKQPPLIVFPHGGPHSGFITSYIMMSTFFCRLGYVVVLGGPYINFTTSYLMLTTFFCKLGYCLILVNYRGSTGFGQDYIDSLPGKVGSQDVTDCHVMANHVLSDGYGDWDRVIITGGSHGGFLSLHMIGQYPDFYKVCAVRNPVCNVAAMVGVTDIPNWCYVQAGLTFSHDTIPSSDVFQRMIDISPISHIQKVKAPTLFLIGTDDRRVPPKQGEDYYKKLRARGVKTRMLVYPENTHGLVKLDAEPDYFINMYKWFKENI